MPRPSIQPPAYPIGADEARRLVLLPELDLFGTPPEPDYDQLTALTAELFATPVCLVTLLGQDEEWLKSHWGTDIGCVPRDVSFCNHTVLGEAPLVVEDAKVDPRFRDYAIVTGPPFVRFYAGAPIFAGDRVPLGSLCLLDFVPRTLDEAGRERLARLAAIVGDKIERRRQQRRASRIATEALEATEAARADLLARAQRDEAIRADVDGIVAGIDRLASQLRMVALNAAIEAGHAQHLGRGFSIVAGEVRRLAEDARAATARARALLH